MKPRIVALVAALAMTLAGCIGEDDETTGEGASGEAASGGTASAQEDACGASQLQGLVGTPFDIEALPGGDRPTRVVRPDTMVTMDLRQDRLNVVLDDNDRVTEVKCG